MLIGETLAHYRITAALGAGGMGEVYRATDTKLGREVAIKVLPAEMANDAGRLERFQREAHLLAALNHPHIAAIHGLEEADGQPFLVLELVEGEDLKERLRRGAIPVDEALEIAVQVAEALEEAHNAGIVHRDLKPANVKVTPDGKVKVLDFGLAKAWAGEAAEGRASSASMSESPTLAHSGTQAGVILGTAAYMSPEQARGKPVDKRGDVWAFGVLLWEMLTGRVLFAGDTVTDIIAAVVKEEPDLDALPEKTPQVVRGLIAQCLRKDPRRRLPDIGGARLALQDLLAGTAPETKTPADATGARAERDRRVRERWASAAALVAAGVAIAFAFARSPEGSPPQPATRFVIDAPDGWKFLSRPVVPSPDGRHIAFRAEPDDPEGGAASAMIWLHALESGIARPLAGTEGSHAFPLPFWSPDSRHVGFRVGGTLRKISVADGTVQEICKVPGRGSFRADWNEEGTILFGAVAQIGGRGGLYTVAASGGEPTPLMSPDAAVGESRLDLRSFLPDGRHFLFVSMDQASDPLGVYVGSLDDPEDRRLVVPGDAHLAGRHMVFNRESTLLAQPFDPVRAELTGEPVAIASSVATRSGARLFGVSPGGTLAYLSGELQNPVQLAWLDRKGGRIGTVGEPGLYGQIALSPDERRVAVEISDGEGIDLWVIDVVRGVRRRVTTDAGYEMDPVWSPDSQELAFSSTNETGDQNVLRKGLGGGEPASPLPAGSGATPGVRDIPESWAREGKTLVYVTMGEKQTVWALSLEGDDEAESVLQSQFALDEAQLSPDGRWLAYLSNESGAWEVYIEPFRRAGEKERVSSNGGGQPRWRGDGKELFYRTPSGELMAVDVGEGTAGPEVGLPTALFKIGVWRAPGLDEYGVSADGQRFLVKLRVGDPPKLRMHVVVNWKSLLEKGE